MKYVLFLLTSIFLLSCGSTATQKTEKVDSWKATLPDPDADYGDYPHKYREYIEHYFSLSLKDPESVVYLSFSDPMKEHKIESVHTKSAIYGYSACAVINARNSFGGYAGPKQYWFLFRNGQIVDVKDRSTGYGKIIYLGRQTSC